MTAEVEKVTVPLPEGAQPVEQTETIVTSESSLPTKRLRKRKISTEYDYNEDADDEDKEDDASYHSGEEEDERPRKKQKTPNKRQSSTSLPKSPAVQSSIGSSPASVLAQPRTPLPMQTMQQHSPMQQRAFTAQMPQAQQPAMNMYQMPMMNHMPQQYHQMGYQMPAQYTMPPHMQQTAYAMPQMSQQSYQSMMAQQYSQMHPQTMMHQQMQQMPQMSQQMPQMSQQMPSMSQQMPQQYSQMQQLPPMASHMAQQQQKPVETSTLSPLDYLSNHASKSNYANGTHNGDDKEHDVKPQQDIVLEQQKQHLVQNHNHTHDAVSHHEEQHASVQHAAENLVAQQQIGADAGENKKQQKTPKAKPEKRLSRFRSAPTQAIRDRIYRAKQQRMYLIDRNPPTNPHEQSFYVLGSVGNVYTVKISHIPSCTCPDHAKGNLCKHILFVFLKVLRVPSDSNLIYQNALLTEELESIFKSAPAKPTAVLASKNVRDTFDKVMGKTPEKKGSNDDDGSAKRKPIEDSMCPICYEDLKANDKLVWCKTSCGQNLHEECFNQWKSQAQTSRRDVTCVFCRAQWPEDTPVKGGNAKSKVAKMNEGYMNLASLQPGLSRVRDTSSYNSYWYDRY